jgi:hypothetical protein
VGDPVIQQKWELPPIRPLICEHRLLRLRCPARQACAGGAAGPKGETGTVNTWGFYTKTESDSRYVAQSNERPFAWGRSAKTRPFARTPQGAVRRFTVTYNREWLLERHGYRTPIEAREHLLSQALVA